MTAIQQTEKYSYGPGRVFILPAGATSILTYGDVNSFGLDLKVDQKPIFAENGFPIAVFDGRKQIDISVKHYRFDLLSLANDLNQSAPGASTSAYAIDEAGAVPAATPFTYTLVNGASYVANTLSIRVFVKGANNLLYPVTYSIVAVGSEVAGKSCSVTPAGVVAFAAADAGLTFQATYEYTDVNGSSISLTNTYQNSAPSYKLIYVKRDRSQIDGAVGQTIITLNAVRFGGVKWSYDESKEVEWDRTLSAFSDPTGNVGNIQFVNTTSNDAP